MDIRAYIEDEIGWVVIDRPSARNALSRRMWDTLPIALASLQREGARVVIFQGEDNCFCAGADLAELAAINTPEDARALWTSIRDALNAVAAFELPTIATITGSCMGGGCLLACACDIRFCEPSARFSIPVAQLGITLDQDNIARLISIVGRGIASQLLFTGSTFSAQHAEAVGLVNGVMPVGQLEKIVHGIAHDIKRNSSASIAQTKRSIAQICQRGRVEEDQESVVASYLSDEFRERVGKALSRKT
jgi:enoyl-CoA hydratase/carnithine racemase